jgi:TRAP-type mannitol/chloroaromatic compound transport system substrate-binding protein
MMGGEWEDGRFDGFFIKMSKYSKQLLDKTIEVWQPLCEEELNQEDAREIIDNITGFFSTVKRWDDEERRKQEDERPGDF